MTPTDRVIEAARRVCRGADRMFASENYTVDGDDLCDLADALNTLDATPDESVVVEVVRTSERGSPCMMLRGVLHAIPTPLLTLLEIAEPPPGTCLRITKVDP